MRARVGEGESESGRRWECARVGVRVEENESG